MGVNTTLGCSGGESAAMWLADKGTGTLRREESTAGGPPDCKGCAPEAPEVRNDLKMSGFGCGE